MIHTMTSRPTRRDLALLRAVAAGQCELVLECGPVLIVDGRCCLTAADKTLLTAA